MVTKDREDETLKTEEQIVGRVQGDDWWTNFDVLLTVHLSIILLINQLNAQNLVL